MGVVADCLAVGGGEQSGRRVGGILLRQMMRRMWPPIGQSWCCGDHSLAAAESVMVFSQCAWYRGPRAPLPISRANYRDQVVDGHGVSAGAAV